MNARALDIIKRRVARECDVRSFRLGAVILCKGRVISVGVNRRVPSGRAGNVSPHSLHAEELALIRASRKRGVPKGASLYVARLGAKGEYRSAKPCQKCQELIREAGIREVHHT